MEYSKVMATRRRKRKPTKRQTAIPKKVVMPDNPIFLDVPWDDKTYAQRKGARYYGGDVRAYIWSGNFEDLPKELIEFLPLEYSWLSIRQTSINPLPHHKSEPKEISLRDHQLNVIKLAQENKQAGAPGFVLHHDTGLGKTYTSIGIINKLFKGNILVIAPLATHESWRRSLNDLGTENNNYCIINYQSLKKLLTVPDSALKAKKARTKNKAIATKGKSIIQWDAIICDESQFLKNPISLTTQTYFTLRKGTWRIWSSATPGEKISDFVYMSDIFEFANVGKYSHKEHSFAKHAQELGYHIEETEYGSAAVKWDDKHTEDNELLHDMLFKGKVPLGDVRTTSSIPGWPELQRIPYPIRLDKEEKASYDKLWLEFRKEHELAKKGKNPDNGLVARLRFRQKSSILRVPYIADLTETLINQGKQVPISVEFKETTELLSEALTKKKIDHVIINGEVTIKEKEANRLKFQRGEVPVVIYSVKEGVSFHANEEAVNGSNTPRAGILADPRWSGMSTKQIEGRQHRNGENAPIYHAFVIDTIDEHVVTTTIKKMENMNTISGIEDSQLEDEFIAFIEGKTS